MQIEVEVDGPDGIPDNPGDVVWEKPVRTDMSANNNFNLGLSATLSLPLVASPMDTICEYKMANEMLDQGGVGVIHRFQSIENQAKQMKRVWTQWDSWYNIGGDKDRTDHTQVFDEWYKGIRHWNHPPTKSDYVDLHDLLWFADEAKNDVEFWS